MDANSGEDAKSEIEAGERFAFGANWTRFLKSLNQDRIHEAEKSLCEMLERNRFENIRFLDAGSGSGLFSLAARRLGGEIVSFDFDAQSVACTKELRSQFFPQDLSWDVRQGSVLDPEFLESLGTFDVVYSWGVLHHTGDMWRAMGRVIERCRPGGKVFISIYNDQGKKSIRWRALKRFYCSGWMARYLVLATFVPLMYSRLFLWEFLHLRNPIRLIREYKRSRGMSKLWDIVDWLGGFPFEVAKPEAVFDFFRSRGFRLEKLQTNGGYGCNQFVFLKEPAPSQPEPR